MLYSLMKSINKELYGKSNNAWNLLDAKEKIVVAITVVVLVVSGFMQAITYDTKGLIYKCGLIGLIISVMLLAVVMRLSEKKHLDEKLEADKEKIELLQEYLADKLNITTKEQYGKLIDLYEEHLKEIKQQREKRAKIIVAIVSGIITIIEIFVSNRKILGNLFYYVLGILIAVVCAGITVYVVYKLFEMLDDTMFDYERTVENLKCVLILLND